MALFDDLVAVKEPPTKKVGMFSDLVGEPEGMFSDLVPDVSVSEPKDVRPEIGPWKPTIPERVKFYIQDAAMRSPLIHYGKRLGRVGLHHLSEAASGLGLYIPDVVAGKLTEEDTLAEAVDKITGFKPTRREIGTGEAAKFITSLQSVGKVLGPVIAKIPARQALQTILGTGVVFGTRKATEEIAQKISRNDPVDVEGIHFDSGIGILFGAGEVGVSKFVQFIKNIRGLPKAQIRPARAEVNAALKHYRKTGDRTQWDAVRIKYAGITPRGVERIKARAAPPSEVKEFGKYPLAKAQIRPPAAPKVGVKPEEGIKLPLKPIEAVTEGKITSDEIQKELIKRGHSFAITPEGTQIPELEGVMKAIPEPMEAIRQAAISDAIVEEYAKATGQRYEPGAEIKGLEDIPELQRLSKEIYAAQRESPPNYKKVIELEKQAQQIAWEKLQTVEVKPAVKPKAVTEGKMAKPTILSGYPKVEYKFTGEWRRMELGGQSKVARRNRAIAEVPVYKSDEGKTVLDMTQQVIIKPYRGGRVAPPAVKPEAKLVDLGPAVKPKGKPGFVDITPVLEAHKTFMRVLEPAKAVERKLGKEAYAAVIKAVHQTDVARVEFEQKELPKRDKVIAELEEYLDRFSDKDLDNLMRSRGDPVTVNARLIKQDAIKKLPKELRSPKLLGAIQHIADFNYKYLQSVVGDDIDRVSEYFYGIYKDAKKVDKFLDFWRTTKRFTKEKKIPTYADAKDYGLEIKDPNPVRNLKAEYVAIAHLEGMNWLKDELMRTGEGKYIDNFIDAPVEWDKVNDPVFSGLRVEPDLAKLINNLIATNKLTKVPVLNTLREVNNFLRTVKFIGSAFHLLSVAKQSVADSGYIGFYKVAKLYRRPGERIPFGVKKGTAIQGITSGFRKNDPIFKTLQYKDYIRHGGGHRYSIESESRKTFNKFVRKFTASEQKAIRAGALPLRIPTGFVNWMFNSYIPKVKYAKYLDVVDAREKKLQRPLKSSEKIDIVKEQQNFYGMMNERLFGRSGTVTTALRFYFLSPGYAEGNYRTMIKAATQWGGGEGFRASRSRSNIVNSLILTGTLATVGTLIMTGKPPKKPETREDLRDLFKIDTGKVDDKGRKIMIDLMTYDKDYWQVAFNVLKGRPDVAVKNAVKRIGGMKAPTADMIVDLALVSMGRAVYDWKGDRITEITDPFLRRVMKLATHEVKKLTPISVGVYGQARRRNIDRVISATETLLGFRPTKSEKDKREQAITSRIFSLKGQQEELYQYLATIKDPRRAVERYNKTVDSILSSPMVPQSMRKEWEPKLLIDLDRYLENRVYYLSQRNRTEREIERATKILKNFGITAEQAQEHLARYWARERRKAPAGPLERDRVIGRGLKRRRLKERLRKSD